MDTSLPPWARTALERSSSTDLEPIVVQLARQPLTEKCETQSKRRQFDMALQELQQARSVLVQRQMLLAKAEDMAVCGRVNTLTAQQNTAAQDMNTRLTSAKSAGTLSSIQTSPGLLGLDHPKGPASSLSRQSQQTLCDMIDDDCRALSSFCSTTEAVPMYIDDVPAFITELQHRRDTALTSLRQNRESLEYQHRQYFAMLCKLVDTLEILIQHFALHLVGPHADISAQWLITKSDAMRRKLMLVQTQVKEDTYTSETMQALHRVSASLHESIQTTQGEVKHAQAAMQAYQSMGQSFQEIVREYKLILEEIENRQWALRELQ